MNQPIVGLSLIAILGIVTVPCLASDDDWPRFRGPNGSGISEAARLPE